MAREKQPAARRKKQEKPAEITPPLAPAPALGARISRRASDRLRAGHVWVYASDVESVSVGDGETPALIPVADNRGLLLGTALYSPSSQIALRMISRTAIDPEEWLKELGQRLRTAVQRRLPMMNESTDACRLCFSEADELPGLVVDKYGDLVILQLLARGLDSAHVRETCVLALREELQPASILERPDPRIRELEGLSVPSLAPLWAADPEVPATQTSFHLNGLMFQFDANAGQKTGAFLDQRLNYAAAAEWAQKLGATGRALDVCTYQGGFALHLARACQRVTGVDVSHASLEIAERNLEANRAQISAEVDWIAADAFDLMRDWSDARESFAAIVVDPPAFAKTRRAVEGALRGYKELNLRALKMALPGGLLVSCSCSHHVDWPALEGTVASAAADAHRRVRVLERRMAAPDHPVVLNLPETEYLKCLVLEVE
ncbi:class I SAM-dependent rRNA methyltransferase [Terracidiphilus gabretensis]|jgi:23S rRNA (cytosine1962-C5)-methyltransferase|uniref:class I SAM-dependent rRNA methyltransferase n=1 Tax=Terracidiphilus gabretensis TaxID=1577687 RepID=UPI00071B0B44|nr:class I SAM-dependent rRNA methyltransferase [Terracidiphilus gabretensis]